ncbi:MAG: hypothetical protein U9N35_06775 [Euryarchaeota archaeon]|nr:hypothetical protein [Euryarchaeota archaeon]
MNEKVLKLFLKEKRMKIFLHVKEEEYATKIRDKALCMYSYVVSTLKNFEKLGLVESKREGRVKKYTLTKKGEKIDKKLRELVEITGKS